MFNDFYKGKKVLVTGHTGFKGSWLSIWLNELGADVYGISSETLGPETMFESLDLKKRVKHYICDITNYEKVSQLITSINPDVIFHMAAQALVSVSYSDPLKTINANVIGTSNILRSLMNLKDECISIFITSDKCYFNKEWEWGYRENDKLGGKDIYSASKAAAEIIISSFYESFIKNGNKNIKICSVRAGNVIGGGDYAKDRIIVDCIKKWRKGEKVYLRSPNATRPWQHVLEPLSGYLKLASVLCNSTEMNGESFNFGPSADQNKSVLSLIKELSKTWPNLNEKKFTIENNSFSFKEAGLLKLNCDKAASYLNWSPTLDYVSCVKMVGDWYFAETEGEIDMYTFTKDQIQNYISVATHKEIDWIN